METESINKMKKNISNDIELRSKKILNLLREILPVLVQWGTVILVAIFLALLLVVCFVPYPNSMGSPFFNI